MTPVVELQQVRGGGLRGVDLRVDPGERVGIVGSDGSGGAIVAPLVVGTALADGGRVVRAGRDVTVRPVGDRPGGLGWVSREPRPFPGLTAYENVLTAALANRRWRRRLAEIHARRALVRLGLVGVADQLVARLDDDALCRLEVARVVVAPRQLLVVDHLAEGLGDALRAELAAVLDEVAVAGASLLWVDALDRVPTGVDRLVVLDNGRVVADGDSAVVVVGSELRSLVPRPPAPATAVPPSRRAAAEPVLEVIGWRWEAVGVGSHGFDVTVARDEVVVVTSDVGHRASRFLRSLAGLLPGDGELVVAGADLTDRRPAARASRGLGFVPRTGGLVDTASVADHLALGRSVGRRGPWSASAVLAMLPELVALVDEPLGRLAPLERRLTSLGRALVGNPRALLVEDPTGGLDERAANVVLDALAVVSARVAVLVTEPRGGRVAARAARIVPLEGADDATTTAAPTGSNGSTGWGPS